MKERWHTTVTELMNLFRESLIALIPVMERSHIPWREPDSYDDWGSIQEALYRNIVENTIRWGLPDPPQAIDLPPLSRLKSSYANLDWIEVVPGSSSGDTTLIFVGFSTHSRPFDHVDIWRVDQDGVPQGEVESLPLSEVRFHFSWRGNGDVRSVVERLDVLL
ncbi:hypothetical protein [Deinococcus budaensis]|uniref:Uncharacterized protein n=1 Tax=Deinococcus budaensis TaxID=1665626 RepID=A0A7W8LRF8_9DEIO|nr:hypothetical protein [Deinococcus budaensis]MBB5235774.1 hypothetical protein [Deinococcus budaensis]